MLSESKNSIKHDYGVGKIYHKKMDMLLSETQGI